MQVDHSSNFITTYIKIETTWSNKKEKKIEKEKNKNKREIQLSMSNLIK